MLLFIIAIFVAWSSYLYYFNFQVYPLIAHSHWHWPLPLGLAIAHWHWHWACPLGH